MTSCGYKFPGVFILLNCPSVSRFPLWLHLVMETSCVCTGWLLFGPRLVSDTLSCDPISRSESSSCLVFVLLRFDVSYWLGCYIFIVIRYVSCLFACHHITILLQGCCNSLIVLVIQLFDKSPKLLIIPFKIKRGCFGFSSFHWSCYRMPGQFDPHLKQYNGCS